MKLLAAFREKMKKEEAEKNKGKDLGKVGITKFKSRSFGIL